MFEKARPVLKVFAVLICAVLIFAAGLIGWLTVTEYKPDKIQNTPTFEKSYNTPKNLNIEEPIKVLTFNIGYGNHTGGAGGFACNTGRGVFFKKSIKDCVGDLVTDFVGMTFGYGFRGEEMSAHKNFPFFFVLYILYRKKPKIKAPEERALVLKAFFRSSSFGI